MSDSNTADTVVIGAGIIGVACALQLARQGRRVVVIDPQPPGMGASYGNAGHLATEQVFPIADVSILKRLPAMQLCVRDARMPRADFLRQFPGNEVDESWSDGLAKGKGKYAEAIGRLQPDILRCQQKLIALQTETGLTIAEIKDINRRMSIGEAKARRAKKEMVEANLRLVISIEIGRASCRERV